MKCMMSGIIFLLKRLLTQRNNSPYLQIQRTAHEHNPQNILPLLDWPTLPNPAVFVADPNDTQQSENKVLIQRNYVVNPEYNEYDTVSFSPNNLFSFPKFYVFLSRFNESETYPYEECACVFMKCNEERSPCKHTLFHLQWCNVCTRFPENFQSFQNLQGETQNINLIYMFSPQESEVKMMKSSNNVQILSS